MEVYVVIRNYQYYDDSHSDVIGVRESEAEAKRLVSENESLNEHPLMGKKEWFENVSVFYTRSGVILNSEQHSPKKGGWVKKYKREQLPKDELPIYDRLCEFSGDMNYSRFWMSIVRENPEAKFLMMQFLCPEFRKLTFEQFVEVERHYIDVEDPDRVTYSIEKFETRQ